MADGHEDKAQAEIKSHAARLTPGIRWRTMSFLCVTLALIIGVVYALFPFRGASEDRLSSGPISNHHAMIGARCSFCHGESFTPVNDKECGTCHAMSAHSHAFTDGKVAGAGQCIDCHREHKDEASLTLTDERTCNRCHANIRAVFKDATVPDIRGFSTHPQFSVQVQPLLPDQEPLKVRLDDTERLRDNSYIKLNHQKHLTPLRGPNGITQLHCNDCHTLSADFKSIEPISYTKHCKDCHTLEFDDRLPGRQVPHGDPDVVYKFLYAEYAKLALKGNSEPGGESADVRAIPGVRVDPNQNKVDFTRAVVERQSREAEGLLFTKTACYLCHKVIERDGQPSDFNVQQVSRYTVMKPQIPSHWMPAAKFSHGAHEEVKCEECHPKVSASTKTNDVLLPGIEKCTPCHTERAHAGLGENKVRSDCTECHSYHHSLAVPEGNKRLTKDIVEASLINAAPLSLPISSEAPKD